MSDVFDRNVVLFVFFVVYLYLKFLELKSSSSSWKNLTCNPLNLFSNSLFQTQEEANTDFERCIVNISANTTKDLFAKEVTEQNAVLLQMSDITTNYTDLTDEISDYITDISNSKVDISNQIVQIQTSQDQANNLSQTTSGFVQDYINQVQSIFDNITSYLQK